MKKILYTLVLLSITLLTSCDYLDVVPESKPNTEDIWKTAIQAQQMLNNLYDYNPDRYHVQTMPDNCAGDDFFTGWYGFPRYFHWKSLVYKEADPESASSTYYKMWDVGAAGPTGAVSSDLYKGIRYCYYFLNNISTVPDITDDEIKTWSGEAYFLIAYYHQTLLEYYGPTILIKKEISFDASPKDVYQARAPYDSCVNFIADKYRKAIELLPARRIDKEYGHVTAAAAYGQLARLLLYAASPLVNGNSEFYANFKNKDGVNLINQIYDKEKWKKAMDVAKEAIKYCEDNSYKLWTNTDDMGKTTAEQGKFNYHGCFVGSSKNNGTFFNTDEILLGLNNINSIQYNAKNIAPRYGYTKYNSAGYRGYLIPSWAAVEMYYSKDGLPMDVDPDTKGLNLYSVASGDSTALLNRNREPRFYASIGYDRGLYEFNSGTYSIHSRYGEPQGYDGVASNEYQTNNGYFCQKWISKFDTFALTGKTQTVTMTFNNFVYPYLRLAELYLDYAEAEFEYNGTLDSYALDCLNKVRNRSGLPNFEVSWAKVGGIPTGDNLRQILHKERSIEFLMEGRRFHDLRRWKTAETEMMRVPKSWTLTGKTAATFYKITDMKEFGTRLFTSPKNYWLAIPLTEMNTNYNLVQNPGY